MRIDLTNRTRLFRVVDLFYICFVIHVVQSMAFPYSSYARIIRVSTLILGVLSVLIKRQISFKRVNILVVVSGLVLIIESYLTSYVYGTKYLTTTSGRLTSIAIITINIVLFMVLDEINFSAKKLDIAFCLISVGMILASFLTYNISEVIRAVVVGRRLGGDFSTINLFGMNMATLAIFLLHSIISTRRYIVLKVVGLVIFAIFTASSGSRASLLCLLIGVLFYLLMTSQRNKLTKVIIISIVVMLIFYLMSIFSFTNAILNRVSTLWSKQDTAVAESDASRLRLIMFGLESWLKRPLFGYGFNAFTLYSRSAVSFNTYSHNNYVEILFNNGIVGLFCFYFPRVYILTQYIKLLKNKKDKTVVFLVSEMLVLLLLDLTIVSYYYLSLNFIWVFAWAYYAYYIKTINSGVAYE